MYTVNQSETSSPDLLDWLQTGYDIMTGQAELEEPKVEFATPTTTSDWLKNPLLWIGVAGIVIALARR